MEKIFSISIGNRGFEDLPTVRTKCINFLCLKRKITHVAFSFPGIHNHPHIVSSGSIKCALKMSFQNGIPLVVGMNMKYFHEKRFCKTKTSNCIVYRCDKVGSQKCVSEECEFTFCDVHANHEHYQCYEDNCSQLGIHCSADFKRMACKYHAKQNSIDLIPAFTNMSMIETFHRLTLGKDKCVGQKCYLSPDCVCEKRLCRFAFCKEHKQHKHYTCSWSQGCEQWADTHYVLPNGIAFCPTHGKQFATPALCKTCRRRTSTIFSQCQLSFKHDRQSYIRSSENCIIN